MPAETTQLNIEKYSLFHEDCLSAALFRLINRFGRIILKENSVMRLCGDIIFEKIWTFLKLQPEKNNLRNSEYLLFPIVCSSALLFPIVSGCERIVLTTTVLVRVSCSMNFEKRFDVRNFQPENKSDTCDDRWIHEKVVYTRRTFPWFETRRGLWNDTRMFQLGTRMVKDSKIKAEKKFKDDEFKRLKD